MSILHVKRTLASVFGALVLVSAPSGVAYAECKSGFVWRDAQDGDAICVTPAERDEAKMQNANAANNRRRGGGASFGPNECRDGYVWREAFPGDMVCVTPHERSKAKQQNALHAQRTLN